MTDDLRLELDELRRLVAAQQDQIAELRRAVAHRQPAVDADQADREGTGEDDAPVARRHLLRRAGTMAAGAAVGGVALALADQTPAAAATVTGSGNPGVIASGVGGYGLQASTNTNGSAGVHAMASMTNDAAIFAERTSGTGATVQITNQISGSALAVTAYGGNPVAMFQDTFPTANGAATIYCSSSGGTAAQLDGRIPLGLTPAGLSPIGGRAGSYYQGHIVEDTNGDLWLCVADGAPGTWRKLGGPATAGQLHVLAQSVRVYDSRPGNPPLSGTKTPITGAADRTVGTKNGVAGGVTVPAVADGAIAAMVNLTIVNTSASGFLGLYKTGVAWPGNSNINWGATGTVLANMAIVALDSLGRFNVKCSGGSSTDFLVDVIGYYL